MLKKCIYILVFSIVSCSDSEYINTANDDANAAQEVPLGPPAILVNIASAEECTAGGNVYTFFNDANSNGIYDDSENLIQRQIVCNGVAGINGENGNDGANGFSLVMDTVIAHPNQCVSGGHILLIASDVDRNGVFDMTDANVQSLTICNGNNGADGSNGADGQDASRGRFTPVDMVMACGNSTPYKEVLMILQSGDVLASFSNNTSGDMTRLSFLPDGTFMNTDSSGCIFTLSTSIDGTLRSISWGNSVQKTWPINP